MFCLCVSGRMEPSADRTKIEITHCNTVFQPISNKCLSRGHSFSWCEELWALWCEEMGFMGYQVKQLMVRGSARSQGWDPAAPPRAMNGTELLSPELETQTCTRWSTRAGTGGSHRHGVFFRDPKSNEIQCSFYFFFYSVIGFQSPLACPSLGAANSPAGLCACRGSSAAALAPLRGLGLFHCHSLNPNLGDKEETASRSFHVSPSCLPIRVKIWFHSWKVPLFQ